MELPKEKVKASRKSPKNMIIYGPPKIGKTTVLSKLDGCLIIDLEDGSDMLDALKIKVNNLKELADVGREIIKQGKPYKYIAIDTISKLEEWCEAEGKKIYMKTPMHLRLKKGMLVSLKKEQKFMTALVVSDVYMIKSMFNMVDVISQGKKRRVRTTRVREIYV